MNVIPITFNANRWSKADDTLLDAVMDDDLPRARDAFKAGARPMAYHNHVDGLGEGPFWTLLAGTVPDPLDDNFAISLPMLTLFIQRGANLNHHHDDQDTTPLWAVCDSGAGNAAHAARLLIEGGAVPDASHIVQGVRALSEEVAISAHGDVLVPPNLPPVWDVIWSHLTEADRQKMHQSGPFFGLGTAPLNSVQMARARWLMDHGASLDMPFFYEGVDCAPTRHLDSASLKALRGAVPPPEPELPTAASTVVFLNRRRRAR